MSYTRLKYSERVQIGNLHSSLTKQRRFGSAQHKRVMSSDSQACGGNPYGFDLSKGMFTLDQAMDAYRLMGPELTSRAIGVSENYLALLKSCVPLQYGAARSASSSGASTGASGSDRCGASLSSGVAGSRLDAISRVKSWRRSTGVVDGYCYSKLFSGASAEDLSNRLGSYPTLGKLARVPANSFQSLQELERFRLEPRGEGVAHVAAGGNQGESFLNALRSYAGGAKLGEGSIGAVALASGTASAATSFTGKTLVGGLHKGERGAGSDVGADVCPSFAGSVGTCAGRVRITLSFPNGPIGFVFSELVRHFDSLAGSRHVMSELVLDQSLAVLTLGYLDLGSMTSLVTSLASSDVWRELLPTGVGLTSVVPSVCPTSRFGSDRDLVSGVCVAYYDFDFPSESQCDRALVTVSESVGSDAHVDVLRRSPTTGTFVCRSARISVFHRVCTSVRWALREAAYAVYSGASTHFTV